MKILNETEFKKQLMNLIVKATGCKLQDGKSCSTCFFDLCNRLGLGKKYSGNFYDLYLILKGDYTEEQIENYKKEYKEVRR